MIGDQLLRQFRWLFAVIIVLSGVGLGVWFAQDNPSQVAIIFYGITLPEMAIGSWVYGAFALGILLGFVLSMAPIWWSRQRVRLQNTKIKKMEAELNKWRNNSLRE